MIRADRELLTELARLSRAIASLALRIMDCGASTTDRAHYAQRLIAVGERLRRRADEIDRPVIERKVLADDASLALAAHAVKPDWGQ